MCFLNLYQRSMYFDEDGDLAHEFYEEIILGGSCPRSAMKRKRKNLIPQVPYATPNHKSGIPQVCQL